MGDARIRGRVGAVRRRLCPGRSSRRLHHSAFLERSEEYTSELQSPDHLVCRLLLEKKNQLGWTYEVTGVAKEYATLVDQAETDLVGNVCKSDDDRCVVVSRDQMTPAETVKSGIPKE